MTRRSRQRIAHRSRPINLSRMAFRHLAAALGLAALLTTAARADWTLQDCNFKEEQHFIINTWTPGEGLSITTQSGKLASVPTRDVLELTSGLKPVSDPASRGWRLALRNGDVLYGDALGLSGKSLLFKIAELGSLAVPLKRIASLSGPVYGPASTGDAQKRVPAVPDHDLVIFRETGDRLEGFVTGIDDTSVQFATDAGGANATTAIALAKIETIIFGGAKPPREIPPLSVRLAFYSGSVYTVPLRGQDNPFNWTLSKVTVKDAAGKEHTTNSDRIVSAEILGGRVVFVTELDLASEEQSSFLGTGWPAQFNRNVVGQPLRVARQTYARGIGVHTRSTLVYELDGTFDTLALRVGMDDSAAPLGEARASIVLDGKTLWQSGDQPLKPGTISGELALPIKGGKRLELHADPTDRLDVQGRVDWIDVALRRQS
jgi:hypothetical protein